MPRMIGQPIRSPICDEQQQQRQAGDDLRHDQRRGDHRTEQGLAAETAEAHQQHRRHGAEHHRGPGRLERHPQADPHRIHELPVAKQLAIPLQSKSHSRPSPAATR
jgi:hypothetical protein